MTTDTPEPDYLTVKECATGLSLTPMTIYRMIQADILPAIRTGATGRAYRIPRIAFEEYQRTALTRPATDDRTPA